MPLLRAIAREPLVQFLVLGAVVFVLWRAHERARHEIDLGAAARSVTATYQAQYGRQPSPAQFRALLDGYVQEEIFYREGRAMGLGDDDVVVRRRIAQKYAFLTQDLAAGAAPTDTQLGAYYRRHADRYVEAPRVAFEQVFFATADGTNAQERAKEALPRLRAGQPVASDAFPGPSLGGATALDEAERLFGVSAFTAALAKAPENVWSGPFASAYGWHLLRVRDRLAGRLPPLDEVRSAVLADYRSDVGQAENAARYRELLRRYHLTGAAR